MVDRMGGNRLGTRARLAMCVVGASVALGWLLACASVTVVPLDGPEVDASPDATTAADSASDVTDSAVLDVALVDAGNDADADADLGDAADAADGSL